MKEKMGRENDNMEINTNYTQTIIKNKDIRILDINSLGPSISISDVKSWLLIKKADLRE